MLKTRKWYVMVALIIATIIMVACGGGGDGGDGEAENTGEVTIFGAIVDTDAERFEASMVPFEEETGIDVVYEGSGDFESLVTVRAEGGDPPDIALFPQPGLMADIADDGHLVDISGFLPEEDLQEHYIQSWIDLGKVDGTLYGVWYRTSPKSLVWYPVPEFSEAGYEIPETWDEMLALSDQMVADGNTPWCIGIESSGATGWVATDWMEDIMLRTQPPETYDQWVNGELPFDSPEVKNAAQIMGNIWFNEDYVLGGTNNILTVPFGDAPTPMFEQPPACWLHRQANFIAGFFPEDVVVGEDADYFYLPPIDEEYGKPVMGAGDVAAMFAENDRDEVRQVMEYLTSPESKKAWIEAGGFVSPNKDTPLDWYPTEADRGYAEIMANATVFRFDASDLMPAAVGAGSFWTGMVEYVSAEGENLDQVMQQIDAAWPEE